MHEIGLLLPDPMLNALLNEPLASESSTLNTLLGSKIPKALNATEKESPAQKTVSANAEISIPGVFGC